MSDSKESRYRLMAPEELDAWMAEGAVRTKAAEAADRAAGKHFLDEETDRALIDEWYAQAKDVQSIDAAAAFAKRLFADYHHDYGTVCHALSASLLAMGTGADREGGGITGFQAGCVFWGFATRWLHLDGPARLVQYDQLLYPQYDHDFGTITQETADWLKAKARQNLMDSPTAHPDAVQRWTDVASGLLPRFVRVES